MKMAVLLLLFFCSSCALFSPYRNRHFAFEDAGQAKSIRIKVPRGFKIKTENTDSAGNKEQVYRYANGAVYYVAYSRDTARTYQPINEEIAQPLPHRLGGWIYKGQDSSHLFWREVRTDPLTFGYRYVSRDNEIKFDSALNYSSLYGERKSR
jgi:hypothetical protein